MLRLPPLKSIQAFEAVARHLSVKLAAHELGVTPTAVSHQLRLLEDHLGKKLLVRLPRALRLTPEGEVYGRLVREGFERLAAASLAMRVDGLEGVITITTTTSFAGSWLGPRLPRLTDRYPKLSVRMRCTDAVMDFISDGIDVAIRYSHGHYQDLHVAWVLDDYVAPVCASILAVDPSDPSSLLNWPLIGYEWLGYTASDPNWSEWMRESGLAAGKATTLATYSDEHVCLQAAIDGHGVALVSMITAARDIEAGRLIVPFSSRLKAKSYFLVCPRLSAETAKVRAFQEWLLDEADEFRESASVGHLIAPLTP
ncbi:MAG: LysR substrate-binding domain-containing protein [Hyphomicrobium aestuarii]|nr:LysR substrate-binding domain-containing protein [Hyphomicrobium aestuarii]